MTECVVFIYICLYDNIEKKHIWVKYGECAHMHTGTSAHSACLSPSWRNFIIFLIHHHLYACMLRSSSRTCSTERYFLIVPVSRALWELMLSSVADLRRMIMHVCIGRSVPFQLVTEHRWDPAGARKGAGTRRYGNIHHANIHAQFMTTFCSSASALLWPRCSHSTALQSNVRFRDRLQVDPLVQNHP